jgi:Protein of unknown function (DUF3365)
VEVALIRLHHWLASSVLLLIALVCEFAFFDPSIRGEPNDDVEVATSLATMLRAARTVVSRHQNEINDPNVGDKGLSGQKVLSETLRGYEEASRIDPNTIDKSTREGRLLQAQMQAIVDVIDENQETINKKGMAFKGFIPATFARLVNENFGRRAGNEADVKVTAPPELVRNRKARPDHWELQVINEHFLQPSWPKGKEFYDLAESGGRPAFRMAAPEYYVASCLACHGSPKGDIDVTGYPKEGGDVGDLGAVISISLYH